MFGRQFGNCELAKAVTALDGYYHYATSNVLGTLDPLHELTYVKDC